MRYLWIEDFNEGKAEAELKPKWIEYYGLNPSDLIIKKSLNSALEYIENNPNSFDVVLLDINLPIGDVIKGKDYKDYLKDIASYKYLNLEPHDIETRAGFLVFLKLMIDIKFPKERIVFLTANVDSSKITEIDNMIIFYTCYLCIKSIKEYKEFIEAVDKIDEDFDYFESCKVSLSSEYPRISKKLDILIESDNNIEKCIKLLIEEKKALIAEKRTSRDSKDDRNTYNRMESIFLEAGFNPPRAFEKPSDSNEYDKLSFEFLQWKKEVEQPYYKLRSSIMEMCQILINKLNDKEIKNFIIFNDLYINSYTNDTKKRMYSKEYFEELLRYIQMLFPRSLPSDNERKSIYRQVVREISHDWETAINVYYPNKGEFMENRKRYNIGNTKDNFYKLYEKYDNFRDFAQKSANGAFMKILRNWTAHSRLREFSEDDVGFIFIIAMRSFFNLGNKFDTNFYIGENDKNYNYYELKLLNITKESLNHDDLVGKFKKVKDKKDREYRSIRYSLKDSFDILSREDHKNKYAYTYNVFTKVKNIGDEESKKECRMDHIYRLFWHFMFNSYLEFYNDDYSNPNLIFCEEDELYVTEKDDVLTYLYMYSYYKAFTEKRV